MTLIKDEQLIKGELTTLFNTTTWNEAWLGTWGKYLEQTPSLLTGIGPLSYSMRSKLKGVLPIYSTAPVGFSNRDVQSVRREYGSWSKSQLKRLLETAPHQLILGDVIVGSNSHKKIEALSSSLGYGIRTDSTARAYSVKTLGQYQDYLKTLSSDTRLKLYNRRKRLKAVGNVTVENIWPDIDEFIHQLNRFHQARWGRPCYSGLNLAFIQCLLKGLAESGHWVDLSVLRVDGTSVSVALDIQIENRVYNFQSGYHENFVKGVSLGTLHFGYQIEKAFSNPDIEHYDFMAGLGKNNDYKKSLSTHYCDLVTLILIKPWWLKIVYYSWNVRL